MSEHDATPAERIARARGLALERIATQVYEGDEERLEVADFAIRIARESLAHYPLERVVNDWLTTDGSEVHRERIENA